MMHAYKCKIVKRKGTYVNANARKSRSTLEEALKQPKYPLAEQILNSELGRTDLLDDQLPQTDRMSDLAKAWQRTGPKTKERNLLMFYLDCLLMWNDKRTKNVVADLFWNLRCCLMEDDQDKLCLHLESLRTLTKEFAVGCKWLYEIGGGPAIECLRTMAGSYSFDNFFCPALVASVDKFLIMMNVIWRFITKTSDVDLLIRKMDTCTIRLPPGEHARIEQFETDPSSDRYLERLKNIYSAAWSRLLLGAVQKCAACGASARKLWSCGMCVQEHVKKKARYCNLECQLKDWNKHCEQHNSSFDQAAFDASRKRIATFFTSLKAKP